MVATFRKVKRTELRAAQFPARGDRIDELSGKTALLFEQVLSYRRLT
jgi:hypothetical protein